MNTEEKVSWLNEHDAVRRWSVGEDVLCLLCNGVFKAEDVASDFVGDPTCPLCISSTALDFAEVVKPVRAVAGKLGRLAARGCELTEACLMAIFGHCFTSRSCLLWRTVKTSVAPV